MSLAVDNAPPHDALEDSTVGPDDGNDVNGGLKTQDFLDALLTPAQNEVRRQHGSSGRTKTVGSFFSLN